MTRIAVASVVWVLLPTIQPVLVGGADDEAASAFRTALVGPSANSTSVGALSAYISPIRNSWSRAVNRSVTASAVVVPRLCRTCWQPHASPNGPDRGSIATELHVPAD